MAKQNYDSSEGVWRTVGGRRIFIANGDDITTAMRKSGKFKKSKEDLAKELIDKANGMHSNDFDELVNDTAYDNGLKPKELRDEIRKQALHKNKASKEEVEKADKAADEYYKMLSATDRRFVEDAVKDTIREWEREKISLNDIRTSDIIRTLNDDMNGFISDSNKEAIKQYIAILMKQYHIG